MLFLSTRWDEEIGHQRSVALLTESPEDRAGQC